MLDYEKGKMNHGNVWDSILHLRFNRGNQDHILRDDFLITPKKVVGTFID